MQPMFTEFLLQPWPPNPRFCFFFYSVPPGQRAAHQVAGVGRAVRWQRLGPIASTDTRGGLTPKATPLYSGTARPTLCNEEQLYLMHITFRLPSGNLT